MADRFAVGEIDPTVRESLTYCSSAIDPGVRPCLAKERENTLP